MKTSTLAIAGGASLVGLLLWSRARKAPASSGGAPAAPAEADRKGLASSASFSPWLHLTGLECDGSGQFKSAEDAARVVASLNNALSGGMPYQIREMAAELRAAKPPCSKAAEVADTYATLLEARLRVLGKEDADY